MRVLWRAAAPCVVLVLAVVALLAPGAGSEWFGGVPLSPAGIVALGLVVYAAVALPRTHAEAWLALALVGVCAIKTLAAFTAPPVGLLATYATTPGKIERSTDFPGLSSATRIEPTLDLKAEQFQVHFFSDAARFNFGPDVTPGRDQLPFAVRWDGWLLVPSDGPREVQLTANGNAHVWIDDDEVSSGERELTQGLHALRVEYARPEAQVPRLAVWWQRTPGGALEAVGGADTRWRPDAASSNVSTALGGLADLAFSAVLAIWIALAIKQGVNLARASVGALPLVFLGYGMLLHAPMVGRATILSGLDDWLVYESSARDILLNGPLMDGGQGHAPPFYGQPLYPYVLALAHRLTGEGLFGPLVLQFAALGFVVALTAVLARRAFGSRTSGVAAAASLLVLLQLEGEHFKVARQLFTENVYMPLVMASLIVVVGLAIRPAPPRWWILLATGLLLGATAVARSQFLLFVPFGLLVLAIAWRRRALLGVPVVLAGLVLAILPVTARNFAVSGQLVPISSSGGASLLEFHRPPAGLVDTAALARDPLYEALHLDQQTRIVLAFIRADPRGYLQTLLPLGAHSLGLQGRNDPGVYWPLLLTCVVYALSFALPRVRRLHVWPIHAFVVSHLVVLMLFEADTYGYRLVMPMYAPMVAVAAQVPLAALRAATSAVRTPGTTRRLASVTYATLGWSLVALVAIAWQGLGLLQSWPQREAGQHGLGGPAVQAALAADDASAFAIYVASIDGTPRRFGAGVLPGLRYPWFKWFDPVRSLPIPPPGTNAVYLLSELSGHDLAGDLTRCLGAADLVTLGADDVQAKCAPNAQPQNGVTFANVAQVRTIAVPTTAEAGTTLEARVLWQPLVAHPDPQQLSLQLDDPQAGDGTLWGNGTLDPYPAAEWQTPETLLTRIPIATDPTALPQAYRLTLGIAGSKATATPRVPVAQVTLTPGASAQLPSDMDAVEGLSSGGLELIGARALPEDVAIGSPLRLGFVWRAAKDAPTPGALTVRLLSQKQEVLQETPLTIFNGRVQAATLHSGNVVRDEQVVTVGARVPTETLAVELQFQDQRVMLGRVKATGRAHDFEPGQNIVADFGGVVGLESASLEPGSAKPNQTVTVKVKWRAEAEIEHAYKVFVHVLDAGAQKVIAQRDAEPQDGRAPTTGWVPGERIDDEYAVALPAQLSAGEYPIEVGLYDAKTGDRLRLPNGDTRALLDTRLHVGP